MVSLNSNNLLRGQFALIVTLRKILTSATTAARENLMGLLSEDVQAAH